MVSLKTIFRRLKSIALSALFVSVSVLSSFAAVDLDKDLELDGDLLFCLSGQKKCCIGGKMQCVDENDSNLCLTSCERPVLKCTPGDVEYKPKGDCGTSTRTCCADVSWSGWDESCPDASSCGANECWNGRKCEAKGPTSRDCSSSVANASSGTQTRTATCNSGKGWSYGSWTGTCTCYTGYTWKSGSCVFPCTSDERLITYADGTYCCEFKTCGETTSNGLVSKCKCTAGDLVGYRYESWGPTCHLKDSCINATLPACNERNVGHHYEIWVDEHSALVNGAVPCNHERKGYCEEFVCTSTGK